MWEAESAKISGQQTKTRSYSTANSKLEGWPLELKYRHFKLQWNVSELPFSLRKMHRRSCRGHHWLWVHQSKADHSPLFYSICTLRKRTLRNLWPSSRPPDLQLLWISYHHSTDHNLVSFLCHKGSGLLTGVLLYRQKIILKSFLHYHHYLFVCHCCSDLWEN